jgi:hypothetical protein
MNPGLVDYTATISDPATHPGCDLPNFSPSSPLRPTTGTPGQTSSHVSRACNNAPVGWHTGFAHDTGSSGSPGQPEGVMQVFPFPDSGIAYAGF